MLKILLRLFRRFGLEEIFILFNEALPLFGDVVLVENGTKGTKMLFEEPHEVVHTCTLYFLDFETAKSNLRCKRLYFVVTVEINWATF